MRNEVSVVERRLEYFFPAICSKEGQEEVSHDCFTCSHIISSSSCVSQRIWTRSSKARDTTELRALWSADSSK